MSLDVQDRLADRKLGFLLETVGDGGKGSAVGRGGRYRGATSTASSAVAVVAIVLAGAFATLQIIDISTVTVVIVVVFTVLVVVLLVGGCCCCGSGRGCGVVTNFW